MTMNGYCSWGTPTTVSTKGTRRYDADVSALFSYAITHKLDNGGWIYDDWNVHDYHVPGGWGIFKMIETFQDHKAKDALTFVIRYSDVSIRGLNSMGLAATVLASFGDPEYINPLIHFTEQALTHIDGRNAAFYTLTKMGVGHAHAFMENCSKDSRPEISYSAKSALEQMASIEKNGDKGLFVRKLRQNQAHGGTGKQPQNNIRSARLVG